MIDINSLVYISDVYRYNCFIYDDKILESFYDVLCLNDINITGDRFSYCNDKLFVIGSCNMYRDIIFIADNIYLYVYNNNLGNDGYIFSRLNRENWFKSTYFDDSCK